MKRWWWVGLVIVLVFLIWKGSQRGTVDLGEEYRYKIDDINDVFAIHLSDRSGEIIELKKKSDHWTYNGSHRARSNAIKNLLDAVGRIELQFIPRPQAIRTMVKDLSTAGIKVEIFDRRDAVMKSYYIGGTTPDERGTFIVMDGSDHPAVASMPGWDGGLRARYWMPKQDWRDRSVFRVKVDEIASVKVHYPSQTDNSFEMRNQKGEYTVVSQTRNLEFQAPIKAGTIEAYLLGFDRVGAESFVEDSLLLKSLGERSPFVTIQVKTEKDELTAVSFYPIILEGDVPAIAKIQRYHALTHDGTMYLVQHRVFRELFRGYDFFYEK